MSIPRGLFFHPEIISLAYEKELVSFLDTQEWKGVSNSPSSRRVIHYGYTYDYKSRNVSQTTPMPSLISEIGSHISRHFAPNTTFTQCIVNEYRQKQGINAHIDANIFGDVIATVTLRDPAVMEFACDENILKITLPPRSVLLMSGESRSKYTHSISPNITMPELSLEYLDLDMRRRYENRKRPEDYRRISLTYRFIV